MELLPKPLYGNLNRYWRRRRYQRLDGAANGRKKIQVTRFHGGPPRSRRWRIRASRRLRIIGIGLLGSPARLWIKIKNAYINMMLNLAGNVGYLNTNNVFGGKRIPRSRQVPIAYSGNEIEQRLVFEIYKALQILPHHDHDQ